MTDVELTYIQSLFKLGDKVKITSKGKTQEGVLRALGYTILIESIDNSYSYKYSDIQKIKRA